MVRDDPIHGGNEQRKTSRTAATKNSNWNDGCFLGNTVASSGNCAGNVRAVTLTVGTLQVLTVCVEAGFDSTGKVWVAGIYSSVDNINANTSTGTRRIVVCVVISCVGLIDSIETPRWSRAL